MPHSHPVIVIDYTIFVGVFIQKVTQSRGSIGCKWISLIPRRWINRGICNHLGNHIQVFLSLNQSISKQDVLCVDRIAFLNKVAAIDCSFLTFVPGYAVVHESKIPPYIVREFSDLVAVIQVEFNTSILYLSSILFRNTGIPYY